MAVVIAIDAGTTGVRSFAIDETGTPVGIAYREFPQYFPQPGWVEHDANEIWAAVQATLAELVAAHGTGAPGGVVNIDRPSTKSRESLVAAHEQTGQAARSWPRAGQRSRPK